ncbi:MAG: hypothetical protein WC341_15940, partial [Bacteroidales bacterium]
CQIVRPRGDDDCPRWSPDGKKVVFQTNRNGSWDIYCYDPATDVVYPLIISKYNLQHPVWHPNGQSIVFDSDSLGLELLFIYCLSGKETTRLFNREINGREASFASSSRQVYFSGYNKTNNKWQIYNYDFIYDNLNQLTHSNSYCLDPQVAPDGKHLVYHQAETVLEPASIPFINWYGEESHRLKGLKAKDLCWHPAGLKMYFVSDMDEKKGELYSIWDDGSHLERITHDTIAQYQPAISPDGHTMIIVGQGPDGKGLFLIDLSENY